MTSKITHLLYIFVIVIIGSVGYHFFKKEPEKIIQTVEKVVTQDKIVTKDRIVYVDKKIVTHKKDGDVIIETDHEHSNTDTKAVTDTTTKEKDTTITSFQKNYSIETLFKLNPSNLNAMPNPLDTQINFGVRLFDFPVFAIVGTTGRFDSLYLGVRYEF